MKVSAARASGEESVSVGKVCVEKMGKIKSKWNSFRKKIQNVVRKTGKYIVLKWILPPQYAWHARKPVDKKLVLFAVNHAKEMPANYKGLFEMCRENGYHCVYFPETRSPASSSIWIKWLHRARTLLQFTRLYARCSVLFLEEYLSSADVVKKRPETQVVQLWHACGIMKKWGFATNDMPGWGDNERQSKAYSKYSSLTLSTVSSPDPMVVNGYQAAFHCDRGIIKPLGCPRTDIYFDEEHNQSAREKLLALYPEIGQRKIILYAPTFRGSSIRASYIDHALNYYQLKDQLSDQYVLFVKYHPQQKRKDKQLQADRVALKGFLFDVTRSMKPEDILPAADMLITDYSSIQFEYLLFERPIISFIYDIDKYTKDRGFFYPYEQLAPGPYVYAQEELTKAILTADQWFDRERTRAYKERFMAACDGHSTKRIYNEVFKPEKQGIAKQER